MPQCAFEVPEEDLAVACLKLAEFAAVEELQRSLAAEPIDTETLRAAVSPAIQKKTYYSAFEKKEKKMMRRGRVCRPLVQSSYRGSEDSEGCRISKELWRRSCRRRLRESGRSWSKRPRSRASVLCCCVESSSATYKLQCQGIRTCGSVSGHISWCIERAGWRGWHRFLATSFY